MLNSVLVHADAIESGERVRLRVCDSDRFSSDDAVGVVEVDISELVEKAQQRQHHSTANDLERRCDALTADQPGMRVSGRLHWSIQFFPLWQMSAEELHNRMQKVQMEKLGRKGEPPSDQPIPWWLDLVNRYFGDNLPPWIAEREERRKETMAWFTGEKERDEMEAAEKPSERLRSGVVQVSCPFVFLARRA